MSRNLSREEIEDVVEEISIEIGNEFGYEIVEVEYTREKGEYILRVFIYKENGINLEDCEKMSMALSDKIDEVDPIPGKYLLEVSSPGLDRPIKTDKDLNRSLNKEVELRLYKNIENRKVYEGKLISYTDEDVKIIDNSGEEKTFPRELISLMRLVIKL